MSLLLVGRVKLSLIQANGSGNRFDLTVSKAHSPFYLGPIYFLGFLLPSFLPYFQYTFLETLPIVALTKNSTRQYRLLVIMKFSFAEAAAAAMVMFPAVRGHMVLNKPAPYNFLVSSSTQNGPSAHSSYLPTTFTNLTNTGPSLFTFSAPSVSEAPNSVVIVTNITTSALLASTTVSGTDTTARTKSDGNYC